MGDTPSLRELLGNGTDDALDTILGSIPGYVLSYDRARGVADVQPALVRGRIEDGERIPEAMPVAKDVPVVFPGADQYSITWPLRKGSLVLLVYASGSLDKWKHGDGKLVDPGDDRRHDPSDVFAIPGIRTIRRPLPPAATGGAGPGGADDMILSSPGLIICGGDEPLVTRAEFLGHGHPIVATGAVSPTPGPVAQVGGAGSAATFPGTDKLRG